MLTSECLLLYVKEEIHYSEIDPRKDRWNHDIFFKIDFETLSISK